MSIELKVVTEVEEPQETLDKLNAIGQRLIARMEQDYSGYFNGISALLIQYAQDEKIDVCLWNNGRRACVELTEHYIKTADEKPDDGTDTDGFILSNLAVSAPRLLR